MFVALEDEKKISAKDAIKGNEYRCPVCGCTVIVKNGEHRVKHFAHKAGKCTDTWHYDMTEWHKNWQEKYPLENREVVMIANGKIHRADVCIGKYVIEFQHNPISTEEFDDRNEFYCQCGYKVLWLFDLREHVENKHILLDKYDEDGFYKYKWKWALKTFKHLIPQESSNVVVCFQLSDEEKDIKYVTDAINKVYEGSISDFSSFRVSSDILSINTEYEIDKPFRFIKERIDEKNRIKQEGHEKQKRDAERINKGIYDVLSHIYCRNRNKKIYPCFKDGNLKNMIDKCNFCKYQEYINGVRICKYRFRNVNPFDIKQIRRDKFGYIYEIEYIDGSSEGYEKIKYFSYSLVSLWKIYGAKKVARFKNMRTKVYVQLWENPEIQLLRSGCVFGNISKDENKYSNTFKVIEDAEKAEWKMEWFV